MIVAELSLTVAKIAIIVAKIESGVDMENDCSKTAGDCIRREIMSGYRNRK